MRLYYQEIHVLSQSSTSLLYPGPPLLPQLIFHVVDATKIEVKWNKPFSFQKFNVTNYTLSIWNTSSNFYVVKDENFLVNENTDYPIRYYLTKEENISDVCHYLEFRLIASNDIGNSTVGQTTGSFPISKLEHPCMPNFHNLHRSCVQLYIPAFD